jgi:2-polyprenyl-6-methoxyphenol hydroxylase-like FAD-dependent oxidoreductase
MRVIINGAGIAGPTLAYWLQKAGHEVVLVEVAPRLRSVRPANRLGTSVSGSQVVGRLDTLLRGRGPSTFAGLSALPGRITVLELLTCPRFMVQAL